MITGKRQPKRGGLGKRRDLGFVDVYSSNDTHVIFLANDQFFELSHDEVAELSRVSHRSKHFQAARAALRRGEITPLSPEWGNLHRWIGGTQ